MSRPKKDILATMTHGERLRALGVLSSAMFGPVNGERVFEQLRAGLTYRLRQPGDAPDPAQNHWRGVWRIHHLE